MPSEDPAVLPSSDGVGERALDRSEESMDLRPELAAPEHHQHPVAVDQRPAVGDEAGPRLVGGVVGRVVLGQDGGDLVDGASGEGQQEVRA